MNVTKEAMKMPGLPRTAWAAGLISSAFLFPQAMQADYPSAVSALNPVAYYRLNTTNPVPSELPAVNSGSLGSALNAEYRGMPTRGLPGAIVGDPDTALAVDGSQSVVTPFAASYNPAGPFTVEAWLSPGDVENAGVTSALNAGHMVDSRSGWILYQNGFSGWSFRMYNQNGLAVSAQLDGSAALEASTWYHVAVVYDGATATLYHNGAVIATGTPTGTPSAYVANVDGPFVIGARSDFAFPWKGRADEVAIYTTALSPAVVQAHYANGINAARTQS